MFAGHGGPNAASFVQSTLFESLMANPKFSTDMKTALGETADKCYRGQSNLLTYPSMRI